MHLQDIPRRMVADGSGARVLKWQRQIKGDDGVSVACQQHTYIYIFTYTHTYITTTEDELCDILYLHTNVCMYACMLAHRLFLSLQMLNSRFACASKIAEISLDLNIDKHTHTGACVCYQQLFISSLITVLRIHFVFSPIFMH